MAKKSKFDECIEEARKITAMLKLKNSQRMRVAELALEACTVIHGGRNVYDRMTITRFAKEIDLNPKTLSEWTRVYRYIYLKLSPENKAKVNEMPAQNFILLKKGVNENSDPADINRDFEHDYQTPRSGMKIKKYLSHLKSVLYNVSNSSRMHGISDDALQSIAQRCREILTHVERELDFRNGTVQGQYSKKVEINPDFWRDEMNIDRDTNKQ